MNLLAFARSALGQPEPQEQRAVAAPALPRPAGPPPSLMPDMGHGKPPSIEEWAEALGPVAKPLGLVAGRLSKAGFALVSDPPGDRLLMTRDDRAAEVILKDGVAVISVMRGSRATGTTCTLGESQGLALWANEIARTAIEILLGESPPEEDVPLEEAI